MVSTDTDKKAFKQDKRIGLALGSGAARGLAHIGVLQALDDAGVRIHYLAGSSIGALIAATYASGNMHKIVDFLDNTEWRKMAGYFDFNFPQQGLLEGQRWMELMAYFTGVKTFTQLKIPLCVITTELITGHEVRLYDGDLTAALRASTSLPGIFNPFEMDGTLMVDGGITNPIPIDAASHMGAEIVIAVNLNTNLEKRNVRKKTIRSSRKKSRKVKLQDLLKQKKTPPSWIPQSLEERYSDFQRSIRDSLLRWLQDDAESKPREVNILDVITNSINIMEYQITENKLLKQPPDILIEPELDHLNILDYHDAEHTIAEGYRKMKQKIPELNRMLED